jgi:SAM-dependent methyltransferase
MRIAREEPQRPNPLISIQKIIGFEAFLLEVQGESGVAACTITLRNPAFLLGQLAVDPTVSTPRHVPLLKPGGQEDLFYHYRQLQISGTPAQRILVCPAVEMTRRASSFVSIDRLNRLVSERPDPYWKPRARLLAKRILSPLLQARESNATSNEDTVAVLDLGAGTGQLLAKTWTYLAHIEDSLPSASFHFVDANPPAFGRSFGLSRDRFGVTHVEWTTADYRALADDDAWLEHNGTFDWVFACRVLDNASNFMIEPIEPPSHRTKASWDCLPHLCLAPHAQPDGIRRLMVSTVRKRMHGGVVYPQFSLRDYFSGLLAVQSRSLDTMNDQAWYLPVRRFNPASLITPSGRSLLAQLMKISRAVIVEDVDAQPEHLKQHKAEFGLPGTAAVFCTDDGFRTEANQFVVTSPGWAVYIKGERLW